MANADLKAKMGDKLEETDKVVARLHAMGRFELSDIRPQELARKTGGRGITLLQTFNILSREIMEMLLAGLSLRSPLLSDRLCLDHVASLTVRLDGVSGLL